MIYEPREDSHLLLRFVKELAKGRVLDMGTGSGIQAIAAAEKPEVKEVIAVDIDDTALEALRKKKNRKIKVIKSNLFMNIGGSFDVMVFNPPYLPDDENDKDIALDGGLQGFEFIERFLHEAKDYLTKDAFVIMVFSNRTGKEAVDRVITEQGYASELLEQQNLAFFEELYVYKIMIAR